MNLILLFESDFIDQPMTRVRLSGRRRDHACSVCRIATGDTLRVGLVNGNVGIGLVEAITGDSLEMTVRLDEPPPEALPLTLILALPRPKVLKRCIEAVTAMGVKRIFIIESWRVEKSYWASPALSSAVLYEHLLLGLEQACDTRLPEIEKRRRFKPFVEDEAPELVKGRSALLAHPYAEVSCPYHLNSPTIVAIGPEGGFIPFEVELFKNAGFLPVSLGKRILRVEHAIPALIGRLY